MQNATVDEVMRAAPNAKRMPYHPVIKGYSLFACFEILARQKHVHRVPVIDADRHIVNVITAGHFLRTVATAVQAESMGTILNKPLNLCPYAYVHLLLMYYFIFIFIAVVACCLSRQLCRQVYTIPENATALEAFQRMVAEDINGLAVISANGQLRDALSVRDLKMIGPTANFLDVLNRPCSEFCEVCIYL